MTKEIARRLGQDGITWETVVVDEDTGGGSAPVSCLLARTPGMDIRSGAVIQWNALFDNVWDFNFLSEIPAGLGLTFLWDDTPAAGVITTTEAGTWSFAIYLTRSIDATWTGSYGMAPLSRDVQWLSPEAGLSATLLATDVLTLPAGLALTPGINVVDTSTANPYTAEAYLSIVRLG